MTLPAACQIPPVVREVARQVEALGGALRELSLALHARPELKFAEHFAADRLCALLGTHGFDVQPGAGGLETAFVARHNGSGAGPTIAVLCEYDALPGISQQAQPTRELEQQDQQQRQDEVELLLHRQRPGVPQRRAEVILEVQQVGK